MDKSEALVPAPASGLVSWREWNSIHVTGPNYAFDVILVKLGDGSKVLYALEVQMNPRFFTKWGAMTRTYPYIATLLYCVPFVTAMIAMAEERQSLYNSGRHMRGIYSVLFSHSLSSLQSGSHWKFLRGARSRDPTDS